MSNITELLNLSISKVHQWARTPELPRDVTLYAKILSYYYEENLERLKLMKNSDELSLSMREILNIRILTRDRKIKKNQLIAFSKLEIEKVYPKIEDSNLLENRFKNLASRFRKKHSNVLLCKQGKYFLNKKLIESFF